MSTLAGQTVSGQNRRPVLARAAVLVDENGQQVLSSDLLARAARHARYYAADGPLEVVLVAHTLQDARYVRQPGLSVVGILAEEATAEAVPAGAAGGDDELPVLVGVAGAREAITEGELVIVDASRGRVLVAPDALAIARAQAEPEPPRLLLGAAHTPAQTRGGRTVAVWAVLGSAPERNLADALAAGADGLLVPAGTLALLLGDSADAAASPPADDSPFALPPPPPDALLGIVDALGGAAVALQTPALDTLDPAHLTLLGARCALRWLLDPHDLPLSPDDLRAELAALAAGEEDQGRFARPPLLAALLRPGEAAPSGFDEAVLLLESEDHHAQAQQTGANVPLYVWLNDGSSHDDLLGAVEQAARRGAAGVLVPPDRVSDAKNRIREVE